MKITEVVTHKLSFPVQRPYRNSRFWMKARPATLVEVRTDSGLIGWGEGGVPSEEAIANHVIGANPFDYELIYDTLSENGLEGNTACAIEIALWDLMGKALDKPVYQYVDSWLAKQSPPIKPLAELWGGQAINTVTIEPSLFDPGEGHFLFKVGHFSLFLFFSRPGKDVGFQFCDVLRKSTLSEGVKGHLSSSGEPQLT